MGHSRKWNFNPTTVSNQVTEFRQQPEQAWRGPQVSGENAAQRNLYFKPVRPQAENPVSAPGLLTYENCEIMHLWCFEPLNCWQFVTQQ